MMQELNHEQTNDKSSWLHADTRQDALVLTCRFNQDVVKFVALDHQPFQSSNKVTLD